MLVTPQADILYERAVDLMNDWKIYINCSNQSTTDYSLRDWGFHTFATYVLPSLLIQLQQEFPHIRFSVQMMNSLEVLQAVVYHTVDLGFIEKPLSAPTIKRFSLMEDQLVLAGICRKGPWLVRENTSGVYYYTKRFLEEKDIDGQSWKSKIMK